MSKRALLIGINYTATPSVQLGGCINDIVNVRNTLIDAYGYKNSNICMLRDDDASRLPTRKNIMYFLAQLINISTANDVVWIHYSGHGMQIRDTNGDESDGFDECIVPCNYNTDGVISDDELFAVIKNAKCRLMLCFDSCNSGTVCDLQYSMNYTNGKLSKTLNNSRTFANTNVVMFSGCRDTQTSADAYSEMAKQGVGAFTDAFLETLRENDHTISILPFYSNLCARLKTSGFAQIPVLSSSNASPNFQFARSNANGSAVSTSTSTNKLVYNKDISSNNSLQFRMDTIFRI